MHYQEPEGEDLVYVPNLLSNEFGVTQDQIIPEIMSGRVEMEGQRFDPPHAADKLWLRKSIHGGKEFTIDGPTRSFKFTVPKAPQED
jgi:hypothetical protein